jgi:hypothetical protein
MNVANKLMASEKKAEVLNEPGPKGPLFMISLVKFKEKAICFL